MHFLQEFFVFQWGKIDELKGGTSKLVSVDCNNAANKAGAITVITPAQICKKCKSFCKNCQTMRGHLFYFCWESLESLKVTLRRIFALQGLMHHPIEIFSIRGRSSITPPSFPWICTPMPCAWFVKVYRSHKLFGNGCLTAIPTKLMGML